MLKPNPLKFLLATAGASWRFLTSDTATHCQTPEGLAMELLITCRRSSGSGGASHRLPLVSEYISTLAVLAGHVVLRVVQDTLVIDIPIITGHVLIDVPRCAGRKAGW